MKTDARIRYTRMRITQAFREISTEKSVDKITVTELCRRAEINRATFYNHFEDVPALITALQDEVIGKLKKAIRQDASGQKKKNLLPLILRGIADQDGSAFLSEKKKAGSFSSRVSSLMYHEYFEADTHHLSNFTQNEREIVFGFLAGGCGDAISRWVKGGMQQSPQELADILHHLCAMIIEPAK